MHRIHIDDLKYLVPAAHFGFLRKWLEQHQAVIVVPDEVQVPNNFMPGNFTSRPGRWGEDEPYPPYGGVRKQFEDAADKTRSPSPDSVPLP